MVYREYKESFRGYVKRIRHILSMSKKDISLFLEDMRERGFEGTDKELIDFINNTLKSISNAEQYINGRLEESSDDWEKHRVADPGRYCGDKMLDEARKFELLRIKSLKTDSRLSQCEIDFINFISSRRDFDLGSACCECFGGNDE